MINWSLDVFQTKVRRWYCKATRIFICWILRYDLMLVNVRYPVFQKVRKIFLACASFVQPNVICLCSGCIINYWWLRCSSCPKKWKNSDEMFQPNWIKFSLPSVLPIILLGPPNKANLGFVPSGDWDIVSATVDSTLTCISNTIFRFVWSTFWLLTLFGPGSILLLIEKVVHLNHPASGAARSVVLARLFSCCSMIPKNPDQNKDDPESLGFLHPFSQIPLIRQPNQRPNYLNILVWTK